MVTVFGGRRGRAKRLFQKRDSHTGRAADFLQSGWHPRLAFHHLGERCQANTDDFAFLSQASHRLLEEVSLFCRDLAGVIRQDTKRPSKCR